MQPPLDLSVDQPLPQMGRHQELVSDRPTLATMPLARRGPVWLVLLAIDFLCASLMLTAVVAVAGAKLLPALPLAPLILVGAYALLGVYGGRGSLRGEGGGATRPLIRALVAALFAWSASLLTDLSAAEQLALWALFVVVDSGVRAVLAPVLKNLQPIERWVLVGDPEISERLRAYAPLRSYATVVTTVSPRQSDDSRGRVEALDVVQRHHADRVVIASQHVDDEGLVALVRSFKSVGVLVSLLPRPLDLLEAPIARPSRVGGVPLIEVESLAARDAIRYEGPDRRAARRTLVSVVVPAMNEEKNIGQVLAQLPDDLHEVILVDGNSEDETIAAARRAYPTIRVTTQNGRGKGDALRTGFAAVTGNLIVMLDADGSADPAEIPAFVAALEEGADFAKGSRFLEGGGSEDITVLRRTGNAILSGTANLLHGTHFTDLCYGYNAFWARCLPFISLDVPGFEVETLINLRIAAGGMKITEVPSYELERISGASNLNAVRDGFRVLGTILREARRRRSIHTEHPVASPAAIQQAQAAARAARD